jgi:hypothetical protein
MRFTIFVFAILTAMAFGCSSGGSSNPIAPQDNNEVRSVLCSAADNLEKGDLDAALQFFFNRDKNERILRRLKDSWPILAKALRDARIEDEPPLKSDSDSLVQINRMSLWNRDFIWCVPMEKMENGSSVPFH